MTQTETHTTNTTTDVINADPIHQKESLMKASIQIGGLTKRFGNVVAVDNLSFEVAQGSVTGFLGPNGAGKTTTLRMLLGLIEPTAGSSTIAGKPYQELVDPFRHVGAVLESTGFHPGRRARDHLRVLCVAAGLAVTRVDEVLDEVGLGDVGDRRVKGFSLGMRQRLGLATALLGEPEVLILDEPANGLDPEGVRWLRSFLRSYADGGRSVLVSSHLLAEIAQTVDNVVIIAKGRLVTQSSLADLADRTRAGVWVRTPQAQALREALAAKGIAAEVQTPETVVALETTTEAVGIAAAGAGVVIFEMTAQHFDLEEFFLDLTTPTTNPITQGASR
ncbi:MAG TPA: ABC transporter ATP-binding protein [Acidimicrobiales bacterium]|jgi:ABC-2 type transport system ATP-binding protein